MFNVRTILALHTLHFGMFCNKYDLNLLCLYLFCVEVRDMFFCYQGPDVFVSGIAALPIWLIMAPHPWACSCSHLPLMITKVSFLTIVSYVYIRTSWFRWLRHSALLLPLVIRRRYQITARSCQFFQPLHTERANCVTHLLRDPLSSQFISWVGDPIAGFIAPESNP